MPVRAASPEPTAVVPEDDGHDDIFVLKQLGTKRKRAAREAEPRDVMMDGMAANNDEVAIMLDSDAERARERAERKKARKEAKRAQRATSAAGGLNYDDPVVDEEQPFDYTSAPSILHPPREKYLRNTATTDECEPLFRQYKTCLTKALKERGIDQMLEDAKADNKENDAEYMKPSAR
ncbi:Mitochondrial distribution and morphology protein 35 [Friedmanniomyces endolithicus]|nr:Mitochondrial distribution and morphology protein 35 [Friedmanniomyces endolithicus]